MHWEKGQELFGSNMAELSKKTEIEESLLRFLLIPALDAPFEHFIALELLLDYLQIGLILRLLLVLVYQTAEDVGTLLVQQTLKQIYRSFLVLVATHSI